VARTYIVYGVFLVWVGVRTRLDRNNIIYSEESGINTILDGVVGPSTIY
jgi:hypothetical protein